MRHVPRPATADELTDLTAIWRRAVEATHDFLAPGIVDHYEPLVRDEYLPAREVLVVAGPDGRPAGFIAMDDREVDMLFVDPAVHGTGIGTALLQAVAGRGPLAVDVNEQNPSAHAFYLRRGFVEVGRSPTDGAGHPYPMVHLRRPS